jgi:uncharacterized protein YdhG (YjbR/CyaY superfamily)
MRARPARLAKQVQERKKVLAYLASLPADARKSLQRLRRDIKASAPGAEDCVSYGLPSFRLEGRLLVCYKAAPSHCSFHPMSTAVIRAHAKDLESYSTSPGTVRFKPGKALPVMLVRKLVKTRIAELKNRD